MVSESMGPVFVFVFADPQRSAPVPLGHPSRATSCESRMIHIMKTATIRDLRTRFPAVRRRLEDEGEVAITDHGRPIAVLRAWDEKGRRAKPVDYYARLRGRMPKPLSRAAREALEEAERGER